jgi:tetratricopeptide (TPR) repeat protein
MVDIQIEKLVLDCNSLAVDNLSNGNLKGCLHLLRRAQDILTAPDFPESKNKLMAMTYNNLGCYQKAAKKNNLAIQAFQKALDLKSDILLDKSQAAEIHINICSIRDAYSQYENLILHAKSALDLLNSSDHAKKELKPLAYYYLGKGFQGLNQFKGALKNYKIGLEFSYKALGHTHSTTCMLLASYLSISKTGVEVNNEFIHSNNLNSSKKPSKKLFFENNHCKTPENIIINNFNSQSNKVTPIKPNSFDQEFSVSTYSNKTSYKNIEILKNLDKIPYNKRICAHNQTRATPDLSTRSTSSQSKRLSETNLPQIRASSSKPKVNPNSERKNSSFNQNAFTDLFILEDQPKISEKNFKPIPPPNKKKPPSSARTVHYRKPSTDSVESLNMPDIPIKKYTKPLSNPIDLKKVIIIQKNWRGFKARKQFKILKRKAANVKAQKAVAELEELKKLVMMENSSILDVRKHTRSKSKPLPVIEEVKAEYFSEPIVLIQKVVRMYLARKKYKKIRQASIKIQSFARMLSVRVLYQNIWSAIVFIQRYWRSRSNNKE